MFEIKPCFVLLENLDVDGYKQSMEPFEHDHRSGKRKRKINTKYQRDYLMASLVAPQRNKSYVQIQGKKGTSRYLPGELLSVKVDMNNDDVNVVLSPPVSNGWSEEQPALPQIDKLGIDDSNENDVNQLNSSLIREEAQLDIQSDVSVVTSPDVPTKKVIFKKFGDKIVAIICNPKHSVLHGSKNIKTEEEDFSYDFVKRKHKQFESLTPAKPLTSAKENQTCFYKTSFGKNPTRKNFINDVQMPNIENTPFPYPDITLHEERNTWVSPMTSNPFNVSTSLFGDVADVQETGPFADRLAATRLINLQNSQSEDLSSDKEDDIRQELFQTEYSPQDEPHPTIVKNNQRVPTNEEQDMLFCVAESLLLLRQGDADKKFCVPCKKNVPGICSTHGDPMNKLKPTRAVLSLPPTMSIQTSSLPGAGLGVFALTVFEVGSLFGPMEGEKLNSEVHYARGNNPYVWEVYEENRTSIALYLDCMDESKSNWMRFVNCARFEEEQNLVAEQYDKLLFYKAYKKILPGQELLAWYGNAYGRELRNEFQCPVETQPIGSDDEYGLKGNKNCSKVQCKEAANKLDEPLSNTVEKLELPINTDNFSKDLLDAKIVLEDVLLNKDLQKYLPISLIQDKEQNGALEASTERENLKKQKEELTPKKIVSVIDSLQTINRDDIVEDLSKFIDNIDMSNVKTGLSTDVEQLETHDLNDDTSLKKSNGSKNSVTGSKGRIYTCKNCDTLFTERSIYEAHVRHICPKKLFICEVCKKMFKSADSLRGHKRRGHNKESKYVCTICGTKFRDDGNLRVHLKAHVNIRVHQCPHCDRRFTRGVHLKTHIMSVHEKLKPYLCEHCGKLFTRSDGLRRHEKLHGGVKSEACDVCGATFFTANHRALHENRQHRWYDEAAGNCEKCNKHFLSINGHKHYVHKDRVIEKCFVCGKGCSYITMVHHIKKKHADQYSTCSVCNKVFTSALLQKHMKNVHASC